MNSNIDLGRINNTYIAWLEGRNLRPWRQRVTLMSSLQALAMLPQFGIEDVLHYWNDASASRPSANRLIRELEACGVILQISIRPSRFVINDSYKLAEESDVFCQ